MGGELSRSSLVCRDREGQTNRNAVVQNARLHNSKVRRLQAVRVSVCLLDWLCENVAVSVGNNVVAASERRGKRISSVAGLQWPAWSSAGPAEHTKDNQRGQNMDRVSITAKQRHFYQNGDGLTKSQNHK